MAWTAVPLTKSIDLDGVPEAVSTVRGFVRDTLGEDHPAADVALLLASELVANSVRHSDSGRPGGRVIGPVTGARGGGRARLGSER